MSIGLSGMPLWYTVGLWFGDIVLVVDGFVGLIVVFWSSFISLCSVCLLICGILVVSAGADLFSFIRTL